MCCSCRDIYVCFVAFEMSLFSEKVAIKILDKTKLDRKTQRLLSREISSMEKLHHPNIIRLYEVVETLSKLHLVMEYAGGGELFTKISTEGKLLETECKIIFSQIVSAKQHLLKLAQGALRWLLSSLPHTSFWRSQKQGYSQVRRLEMAHYSWLT
uniref:non-specific serine/threonine protein kinase n=1 Tax=Zosterops lateralis melanops TaxID=1220523 RepID=A0A8D2PSH3_ZOSLA